MHFSVSFLTTNSQQLVDQLKVHRTFFIERRTNCSQLIFFPILDILSHSGDIRDQSRRLCKINQNFACFWPPIFFLIFFWGGALPEFLESIYKIYTRSDHVAKFRGDRPRELGDYALKKENITSKIEDLPYSRTGGLNRVP